MSRKTLTRPPSAAASGHFLWPQWRRVGHEGSTSGTYLHRKSLRQEIPGRPYRHALFLLAVENAVKMFPLSAGLVGERGGALFRAGLVGAPFEFVTVKLVNALGGLAVVFLQLFAGLG